MARLNDIPLVIADLRGGRNASDPPLSIPDDQCVEALNVDWYEGTLANKRPGATAAGSTFSAGGPFTGVISSLIRHVPGASETAAELWAFDDAATPVVGRMAAAATFAAPTLTDALADATSGRNVVGVSFDGKLFLFYDSAQNRAHVWDTSTVRRVGLATPDPPTVATQGGAGLSFTRHYRIRTVHISGSDTVRRSEPSTSVSITITDDTGVTVTRPTLPTNEGETHWEPEYADASTGPWYRASQVATGTTTYSDTAATISTTNLTNSSEIHFPMPSAKYAVADAARLVMAGNYETSGGYTTPKNNRVWWTPPIGALDVGDAERIPAGYYKDVEEAITGLGGPLDGTVLVFSYRDFWRFRPTGLTGANAYNRYRNGSGVGCVRHQTIVKAEDEDGHACVYWLSHKGPYRWSAQKGLQYLGNDCEDAWSTVNLAATSCVAHTVSHADKHQVWFYIATGSGNDPSTKMIFDTRLGVSQGSSVIKGWAKHTGESAQARCSVMFSNTRGATMSRDLKPYIGQIDAATTLWKADNGTDDTGTDFQAYVDTKPYMPAGWDRNISVTNPLLIGEVASGVTITVTPLSSFGLASVQTGTAVLTAAGSETRKRVRVEGLQAAGASAIAFRIGDSAAVDNAWTLDALIGIAHAQESAA